MRKVYESDNIAVIGHVRQVLEQHEIGCIVRNEFLFGGAGEIPINETWPEIWVTDDRDYIRARTLVDAVTTPTEPTEPRWQCRACGELIEGQFTDCWRCGASRPDPDV